MQEQDSVYNWRFLIAGLQVDRKQLFLCERRLGFSDDGLWQVRVLVFPSLESRGGLYSGPVPCLEMLG